VSEEAPAQGYQLFTPVIDTYLKEISSPISSPGMFWIIAAAN